MPGPIEKSHPYLRRLLLQHKMFLYNLYTKSPIWCKRRLERASKSELKTLIRFLVCLEKGHVEIRAKNYQAIVKSKRINRLINLRKNKVEILKSPHPEKIAILSQFTSLY